MKKTYAEIQKELDTKKYYESINQNRDMSGKMLYCMNCTCCDKIRCECKLSQEQRIKINQCARALKMSNNGLNK